MRALILEGKDEFLLKKICELHCQKINLPQVKISSEEDFGKVVFSQKGLFFKDQLFILENVLRKRYRRYLDRIKIGPKDKLIFLEVLPKEKSKIKQYRQNFYLPSFLNRPRIKNIDFLSNSFSFWKKIAKSFNIEIGYNEWKEAVALSPDNISFLWNAIEEKSLAKNLSLVELVLPWAEGDIFSFVENLCKGDRREVFSELIKFRKRSYNPEYIWYFLIRYFIQLYKIKKGIKLDIHPYALRKMKEEGGFLKLEDLENILKKLLEIDLKVKTGFFVSKDKLWEALNLFVLWSRYLF